MSQERNGDYDPLSDPEERQVLLGALDSFCQYRRTAHRNVTHRRRQNFYALKSSHWQMLAEPPFNILDTLERVDDAIDANADIADEILAHGLRAFGLGKDPQSQEKDWRGAANAEDLNKVHTTIIQFYRDWSAEGANERNACIKPVLKDLEERFTQNRGDIRILVPGAGLGRLVFELCQQGYTVEGNEISYHQLLASSWILNHIDSRQQFDLYPFALEFNNLASRANQLRAVKIPDLHPASELAEETAQSNTSTSERMSMTASDFLVLYGNEKHRGMFDAVVNVFFLDTAPNVIRYMEVIRHCLKEGGIWVNTGPLLWHFGDGNAQERASGKGREQKSDNEGIGEPGSVELTVEEVLLLVEKMGFRVDRHEIRDESSGYIQNPDSLLRNNYRLSHWVAQKKT